MPNKTLRDIAIEIGINVNTLKSRIYRAEMAGKPKARRERETKRRSPLWKRNGDISLGDRCPKCGDAAGEDTVLDLIGYLVLLRVLHRAEDKNAV